MSLLEKKGISACFTATVNGRLVKVITTPPKEEKRK
jgi:hypothetical protein